jgi:hypothetical protein
MTGPISTELGINVHWMVLYIFLIIVNPQQKQEILIMCLYIDRLFFSTF